MFGGVEPSNQLKLVPTLAIQLKFISSAQHFIIIFCFLWKAVKIGWAENVSTLVLLLAASSPPERCYVFLPLLTISIFG
jgi:hypothetical protein